VSIHFISGKPGGGKSLYGVKLLISELVLSRRHIVTNLALKLPELEEYLNREYPAVIERVYWVHLQDRITILSESDLKIFFTYRAGGVRIADLTNEQWAKGERPDYSVVKDSGVAYFLDEVHLGFNARAWAQTGHQVIYYLSQHRKLGDDVICITQHVGNVDKQFRSVAQDFSYIRNLKKEKLGLFRLPGVFLRRTYGEPATSTSQAMETGSFRMDVRGIASCYDTAKGVGIHGRAGADIAERVKGLHWGWFVVGIPVLLLCLFKWCPNMLARVFVPAAAAVSQTQRVNAEVKASTGKAVSVAPVPGIAQLPATVLVETNMPAVIYLTGLSFLNGRWFVTLSDGRVFKTGDGHLRLCTPEMAIVDGRVYAFKN